MKPTWTILIILGTSNKNKMSSDDNNSETEAADNCCASCGIAEVDDIKLKDCDGCDLVRYCSNECKANHRQDHEAKCKERAAELRDELLFRQPESTHLGDCPICCLPLSLSPKKTNMMACCSKVVCIGCSHANKLRQERDNVQRCSCLFCRHPLPRSQEEADRNLMKRVGANDPVALTQMGKARSKEGDYDSAFKYFTKAAKVGDAEAHFNLSGMYMKGEGVEKDYTKEIYHLEEAAIRGHAYARHHLGLYDGRSGRIERAAKHFTIAAKLGYDDSIQTLKKYYKDGVVSKEDFAAALRAHHAAVKAMKSPQREVAEILYAVA